MSDAYDQGSQAYYRGDGPEMNPYDERDSQHDEWDDGWYCAEFSDGDPDIGN